MNTQYFMDSLSDIIDFYSNVYGNHIMIGDFNLEPSQMYLETFMETHNYFNLVKNNACFKGPGSCIDLILTNRKYCFQGASSFETRLNDHHHLISSILKSTFEKEEPKQVIYRDYQHYQWQHFKSDLKSSLNNCNGNFDVYEKAFTSALNSHAPKKVKVLRGNHKLHLNKKLRKAIMERSRLINKANKSKQPTDIASYKKQRNLVISLNKQSKLHCFNSISSLKDTEPFWKQYKPYFSKKHAVGDSKIMLIKIDKTTSDNESISENLTIISQK